MTVNEQAIPNKSIPANLEAERAVLGALLIDPDAIIKVASYLRPEDFYRERHAWLYEALFSLNERREPLDFVTLMDELERRGQLEEIGGPAYISDLVNSTPTAMYVDHYARIVERTAVLRRLISAAGRIAELAYDESQEVDVVMDRAEQIIFGVSESRIHRDLTPLRMIMGNVVERIDELARNPDRLMGVPTGFTMLDRMLGGLQKSDLIILAGRPGMGKCVTGGTQLVDPTTGARHTIAELVQQKSANVLTLNDQFKLQPTAASAFLDDGIKPAFRVQTASGREVEVTLTHPFLTILGWRPLGELTAGELIGVPRQIPVFGLDDAPEHQVKALAYLLADGCLTGVTPQFTNENASLRADFSEAALQFSGTKIRVATSNGMRTPTVYVAGDLDYIRAGRKHFGASLHTQIKGTSIPVRRLAQMLEVSPSLVHQWVAGRCVPSEATFVQIGKFFAINPAQLAPNGLASISKNSPNEMTRWLKTEGVWGKSAAEKTIPSSVFRYTRSKLALFLNRLFACDGSLYLQNASQPAISYSTVSKQLAHDVQHLLLRFGILSKLRHRQIKYKGDIRIAYELRITNAASIQCFCTEIGAIGKEEAVAALLARLQETPENTNLDVIPQPVWEKILAAKGEQSWRIVFKKLGMAENSNLHVGQRAPSRKRLLELADALDSHELSTLAQSDLYWDEITSVEYIGDQQVYDLTIPTTHNFVANDILVHNTSFALSIAQNAAERYDSRVAVFSLEMSNEQLAQRLLSMQTGIDSHRLRMGAVHEDEWQALMEGANVLANSKVFIDDTPAVSVTEVRTKARRLYAEQGLDLILIDYMQLMSGEGGGGGREGNRQQEISYISRSLKSLARELNVPIIALSQLSRAVEARSDKRPMLSDLRESGSIEQDADVVLFIYREDYYVEDTDRQNIADVLIAKHRHGSTGTVSLYFRKELTQFRDLEIQRTELEY